jgi:GINS complex subunit 4
MAQHLQSDPRTSEEEYFRIVLIQTEAERVKFLVRSYLRARLYKVSSSCDGRNSHDQLT